MRFWIPFFVWLKIGLSVILISGYAFAQMTSEPTLTVPMHYVTDNGIGEQVGVIVIRRIPYGMLFLPQLEGLSPGVHGFHMHKEPSCASISSDGKKGAALAAGGHFDPANTGHHAGPYELGHLGDLPALYVDMDGSSHYPVLAPRIESLELLKGHSLVIHAGGDNHADQPLPLGGGGTRVVCGVIKGN